MYRGILRVLIKISLNPISFRPNSPILEMKI